MQNYIIIYLSSLSTHFLNSVVVFWHTRHALQISFIDNFSWFPFVLSNQIKLKSFHIAAWPWHHHRSHLSFQLRLAFPSVRWSSFNVKRSRTVIIYEKGVIGGWMTGWFNCLGVVFFLIFLIPDIGTRQNLHRHNRLYLEQGIIFLHFDWVNTCRWLNFVLPLAVILPLPAVFGVRENYRRCPSNRFAIIFFSFTKMPLILNFKLVSWSAISSSYLFFVGWLLMIVMEKAFEMLHFVFFLIVFAWPCSSWSRIRKENKIGLPFSKTWITYRLNHNILCVWKLFMSSY